MLQSFLHNKVPLSFITKNATRVSAHAFHNTWTDVCKICTFYNSGTKFEAIQSKKKKKKGECIENSHRNWFINVERRVTKISWETQEKWSLVKPQKTPSFLSAEEQRNIQPQEWHRLSLENMMVSPSGSAKCCSASSSFSICYRSSTLVVF